ncbi:MAG: Phosphoribosylformimino-5-aminoimidazole carboxamide ribotide isomerase [Myxococcaceae bacterium]|nr:Phosphoribosylformimino-5-aminoimidazole carboxamide ribotide isomerase [Myxococcaceae bacterium]
MTAPIEKSMELIPSIDVLDGKVVRLHRGDYAQVTVFADDPAAQAAHFQSLGARYLHVVDLDGARAGKPGNREVLERILREAPKLQVQVAGGIRTRESAEQWFALGARRVVLGTIAIKQPALAEALCREHPGGIVIALDAKDGVIAVEGWLEATGQQLTDVAREVDDWGAAAILFTDINRDGTREGPAVETTAALQKSARATVIASGGIGTLDDLYALRNAGVRAAVTGRALYSGAFDLTAAFREFAGPAGGP